MSSLEFEVDSEHETPKEKVRSFLQVRFNVVPLTPRFAFPALIRSTIKLKLSIINQLINQAAVVLGNQNQRSHRVSKGGIKLQ